MGSILPGRARRVVAVLLMAGAALLVGAPVASAHAQLESSDPAAGAVLPLPPRHVTLVFGEPVEPSASSIKVFDDHSRRVPTGPVAAAGADGSRLSVSLPPGLATGTYSGELAGQLVGHPSCLRFVPVLGGCTEHGDQTRAHGPAQ